MCCFGPCIHGLSLINVSFCLNVCKVMGYPDDCCVLHPSPGSLMCLLNVFFFLYIFLFFFLWHLDSQVCESSEFYLMRWYVSQYMKMGCAPAMDMVRYILSWFLAPLTNLPSAAASDNSFRRRVRIWGEKIFLVNPFFPEHVVFEPCSKTTCSH